MERVAEFIANDPMLTARVLQMVNSAALGLRRRFVDANEAVIMLGGERIKSMIVFVEVFSICEKFRFIKFSPEKLWRHSLLVGRIAREIMRTRSRAGVDADASFTGGLLHDVGKLLLAINLPDRYREVLEDLEDDPLGDAWASEVKFLQTSHAEVGAMILESWNLPYSIVEAVGYHHSPNRLSKDGFTPLDAVAVANAIVHERQIPSTEEAALVRTPMNRKIWERWGEEQMADWSQDFLDSN
ncbi:MAG: HDOD domain-containing protein [Verrucomicrobia bacterium]|nr:HDOD domain-containing protein [Verrucomicrobiota bacterium]